jgi:5-methylcytosine-specific restriction endonuclease McrA
MGKRSLSTPRSQVRVALRRLSLRSRERQSALKRDHYTCQVCGVKQSKAKGREVAVEVHHRKGVLWDVLIDIVYEMLLCHPDDMVTLCKKCHEAETKGNQNDTNRKDQEAAG